MPEEQPASSRLWPKMIIGLGISLSIAFITLLLWDIVFVVQPNLDLVFSKAVIRFPTVGTTVVALLMAIPFLILNIIVLHLLRRRTPSVARGVRWGFLFAVLIVFLGWLQNAILFEQSKQLKEEFETLQDSYRTQETGDVSICEDLPIKDEIQVAYAAECFSGVAIKLGDASLCSRIPFGTTEWSKMNSQSIADHCYLTLAVQKNNPSFCDHLAKVDECKMLVARRWGSSLSSEQESAMSVQASIAPLDGCKKIISYGESPWFSALQTEAIRQSFTIDDREISQACLSADYLIFIRPMEPEAASHVYRFSIKE